MAVLRVLRQCIENATVGKAHKDWQNDSHEMMTEEMLRLKLITKEEVKNRTPTNRHVGNILCTGWGTHGARRSRRQFRTAFFQENAVYTVEPGIYIPRKNSVSDSRTTSSLRRKAPST